jgi:hypothetical protein
MQILVIHRDAFVAVFPDGCIKRHRLPFPKLHSLCRQRPNADFRPLQVLQNREGLPAVFFHQPQTLHEHRVLVMRPMRKIQARDIHAGEREREHRLPRA